MLPPPHPPEFRAEAVRLLRVTGKPPGQDASKLGPHVIGQPVESFFHSLGHHSCEMGEQSLDEPRFWSE
jgi:hypothetical protein